MRFPVATLVFLQICLLAGPPAAAAATGRPPNIVLLIGDDHGWPYSGFMGDGLVRTPNLDALAVLINDDTRRRAQHQAVIRRPCFLKQRMCGNDGWHSVFLVDAQEPSVDCMRIRRVLCRKTQSRRQILARSQMERLSRASG